MHAFSIVWFQDFGKQTFLKYKLKRDVLTAELLEWSLNVRGNGYRYHVELIIKLPYNIDRRKVTI